MGRKRLIIACVTSLMAAGPVVESAHAQGPVYFEIYADQNHPSSDPLEPFDIVFIVHGNGNKIQGMVFPMHLKFSHDNILGTLGESASVNAQIIYSMASTTTFHSRAFNDYYGQDPTSPDTMLLGMTSFGSPWKGSGEVLRIRFTPTDTGTIKFDTFGCCLPPVYDGDPDFLSPEATVLPHVMSNPVVRIPPQPGDVRLRVSTHTGTDTIFFGPPATIQVRMDAAGNELAGAAMVFRWSFTNGNIVGPILEESGQVVFSDAVLDAFESVSWNGFNGSPTDTSMVGLIDFDGEGYDADDVAWSVTFSPSDTGTILIHSGIDFTHPPLCCGSSANDSDAQDIPISWIPVRIPVVPCPYPLMGDVNQDALLTSSDLIHFINYLFKSGPDPLPDRSVGDTNCSGGLTAADVIVLVNHIFKSGAPPCACIVRRI